MALDYMGAVNRREGVRERVCGVLRYAVQTTTSRLRAVTRPSGYAERAIRAARSTCEHVNLSRGDSLGLSQ